MAPVTNGRLSLSFAQQDPARAEAEARVETRAKLVGSVARYDRE